VPKEVLVKHDMKGVTVVVMSLPDGLPDCPADCPRLDFPVNEMPSGWKVSVFDVTAIHPRR
jgi:hypothetical protein